jgi:stage III sporulation protein AH
VKTFKRNAVIITVLLFVCVAAYLNWSYNKNADDTLTAAEVSQGDGVRGNRDAEAQASDPGLFYNTAALINKEYFDAARLNRQQARDAAASALASVSQTEGASQEMIDAALEEISRIASDSIKEAELESLIIAKGFADCVVYISDEGISVTVPAPEEGLPASSVARITDVVTSQTGFKAADLKIIEVK